MQDTGCIAIGKGVGLGVRRCWAQARKALDARVLGERASAAGRTGAHGMRLRHGRWGPATRQPEAAIRPGSPATIRRWAGHDMDARARLGAPGVLAGPVGGSCNQFGFLTWAFNSVVFLSRRLDSVHEHCSLQNFFRKKKYLLNSNKNQIKSNKF